MYNNILIFLIICAFCTNSCSTQDTQQAVEPLTDSPLSKILLKINNEIPKDEDILRNTSKVYKPKKKTRPIEVTVDGEKYNLNLSVAEHNAMSSNYTVWVVEHNPESEFSQSLIELHPEDIMINGTFYEDPDKMATVLINQENEQTCYEGLFGENTFMIVLRSSSDSLTKSMVTELNDNFVIADVLENNSETVEENANEINSNLSQPLDVMYMKIIAVVEYRLFSMLNESISTTINYIGTFWNQVNLIYSKIDFPKIKVIVTGIMIEEQLDAMSWLSKNASVRDATKNIKYLYPYYAARRSWEYFERVFPLEVDFENFDAAVIMSNLPVRSPYLEKSHVGGTICQNEKFTAYIHDDGNYGGIGRGARVLGLLLSADHDGVNGNADCVSTEDVGTYMTVNSPKTAKTFVWSECSKRAFQNFAYKSDAECLRYPYRYSRYPPFV